MRHGKSYRKLGRTSDQRRALLRNLATSFLELGRIKTTVPKAKELRSVVEKLITRGRTDTLASRRLVGSYVFGEAANRRVFGELKERFARTPGGYTRIIKVGPRLGDRAPMCFLELTDFRDHEGKMPEASVKKA